MFPVIVLLKGVIAAERKFLVIIAGKRSRSHYKNFPRTAVTQSLHSSNTRTCLSRTEAVIYKNAAIRRTTLHIVTYKFLVRKVLDGRRRNLTHFLASISYWISNRLAQDIRLIGFNNKLVNSTTIYRHKNIIDGMNLDRINRQLASNCFGYLSKFFILICW